MYTNEEIAIANKTCRGSGASVFNKDGTIRSVVVKEVLSWAKNDWDILDYGCGKNAVQRNHLVSLGFNVDAYDFGENVPSYGISNLTKMYDLVYASNVLNVQSSESMLRETIKQIWDHTKKNGVVIMNYPASPRKLNLNNAEMDYIVTCLLPGAKQYNFKEHGGILFRLIKIF